MTTRGQHRPDAALDFTRFGPLAFSSVKVPSLPPGKPLCAAGSGSVPGAAAHSPWEQALGLSWSPALLLPYARQGTQLLGKVVLRGGPREQAHSIQASKTTRLRLALNSQFRGPQRFLQRQRAGTSLRGKRPPGALAPTRPQTPGKGY